MAIPVSEIKISNLIRHKAIKNNKHNSSSFEFFPKYDYGINCFSHAFFEFNVSEGHFFKSEIGNKLMLRVYLSNFGDIRGLKKLDKFISRWLELNELDSHSCFDQNHNGSKRKSYMDFPIESFSEVLQFTKTINSNGMILIDPKVRSCAYNSIFVDDVMFSNLLVTCSVIFRLKKIIIDSDGNMSLDTPIISCRFWNQRRAGEFYHNNSIILKNYLINHPKVKLN